MQENIIISRRTANGLLEIGLTGDFKEPYVVNLDGRELLRGGEILSQEEYAKKPAADGQILEAMRTKNATHILQYRVMLAAGEAEKLRGALTSSLESVIAGHEQLIEAYRKQANILNDSLLGQEVDNEMVKRLEDEVKDLEAKFPVAKAYVAWTRYSPRTPMGKAALKAAEALLQGVSLEEAGKIAEDYPKKSTSI